MIIKVQRFLCVAKYAIYLLFVAQILAICGDVEVNPGPGTYCCACYKFQKEQNDISFFAFPIGR
jgi:hypothetical protein